MRRLMQIPWNQVQIMLVKEIHQSQTTTAATTRNGKIKASKTLPIMANLKDQTRRTSRRILVRVMFVANLAIKQKIVVIGGVMEATVEETMVETMAEILVQAPLVKPTWLSHQNSLLQ